MFFIYFCQILFFITNTFINAESDFYKFAVSLDNKDLRIYSDTSLLKTVTLQDMSFSMDFDSTTNLLIGSSIIKKVFVWNITSSTATWSAEESAASRGIAFLNKTHFIAGFKNFFIVYNCLNLANKIEIIDSTNIGDVYDIKILHEDQKILIASHEGFISIFDLTTLSFLKKHIISTKIWAIDAFDKDLIVSQCDNEKDICHFKLDPANQLNQIVKYSEVNQYFVIKILTKTTVVFGGDTFLKIWNISSNQIIRIFSVSNKISALDIFSNEIIASGDEGGNVRFWNINNGSNFKTINIGVVVNYLKNLNGFIALNNYLNLKTNQHSTQSVEETTFQPTTKFESTSEQKESTIQTTSFETSFYSSIGQQLSSIESIQTVSETSPSLTKTLTETTLELITTALIYNEHSSQNTENDQSLFSSISEISQKLTTEQSTEKVSSTEESFTTQKTSIGPMTNSDYQSTNKIDISTSFKNSQISTLQLISQEKSTNLHDITEKLSTQSDSFVGKFNSSKYFLYRINISISESYNQFLLFNGFKRKIKCFEQCFRFSCNFVGFSEKISKCQIFSILINNFSDFIQSPDHSIYILQKIN